MTKNNLTKENELAKSLYDKKWIKIGENTDRLDPQMATEIIHEVQINLLETEPTQVIILDNPIQCWIACHLIKEKCPVDKIFDGVKKFIENPNILNLEPFRSPFLDGSFSAPLFAFYDFMFNEIKIKIDQRLFNKYLTWEKTAQLGMIFPMENVCFVSQKPITIRFNNENQLHADCDGPAIAYDGLLGSKLFMLNGVVVPEKLATTKSGNLSLDYYNELRFADQKMEFVRKFGVERMLELGFEIDSYKNYRNKWWNKSQYELWDMNTLFPGVNYAPHLKMLNQTTKVWHLEAVSPNCKTLEEALKERFKNINIDIINIA